MGKLIKLLSAVPVAAALLGASPASAQTAAYSTTFYSDATHQTQVGFLLWIDCDMYDNPVYHLVGTYTMFQDSGPIGYCSGGVMYPL